MDLDVLASYNGIEKPDFFGGKQDVMSEMWLGEEIVRVMNDTKVLGGFSL